MKRLFVNYINEEFKAYQSLDLNAILMNKIEFYVEDKFITGIDIAEKNQIMDNDNLSFNMGKCIGYYLGAFRKKSLIDKKAMFVFYYEEIN